MQTEVSEWQFASLTIVPKTTDKTKIITSIRVICTFEGNANEAYFDNICLSREVAQTMDYDDDGNLTSVSTTGLSADANTYEGGNLIETVTGGNGTYTYSYDETYKHRLTGVTDGVITQELTYDRNGNSLSTTLKSNNSSNPLSITTSAAYSGDGNRLTGVTDATGNSISYAYGNATSIMYGLPTTTTDGRGNSTTATYDSEGRTTGVVVPEEVEVLYSYSQGLLTSIERNDLSKEDAQEYHFTYDAFGRTIAIYIGETLLASYVYRSNGDLVSMTYGNGTTVEYTYDILGRVILETYSENDVDGRTVEYFYGNQGQVTSVVDSVSGTSNYIYDSIGRLAYFEQEESGVRSRYIYDTNNRLIHTVYQLEDCYSGSERYAYNSNTTDSISDGIMVGMQLVTTMALSKTFDELQRLTGRSLPFGLTENYTYTAGEAENTTTTQVSGKKNTLGDTVKNNFQYTYDGNGNILTVTDTVTGETITYSYDVQNQLIGAVYSTGRTESYSYDSAGNILSFNNGTSSHTYTYGNDEWKDQLTAVDGVVFTYDAIGNPLTYHNGSTYTMSWTEGRKLATITVDGETTSYLYDADGIRIQKTYSDGSYIRYINAGGIVLGEKHYNEEDELTKSIRYIFDDNGSVCGYMSSTNGTAWTMYHFVTNLQGDVLYVYQAIDKTIVASYSYDSWGNIISATGELADENPFRYRGYYYDVETGFYYLNSRYYDSEIGRFVNSDALTTTGQGALGYNMYAYCGNNPVVRRDAGGYIWETIFDVVSLAFSIADVVANPDEPWAWAGLAGDVIDLVPFVCGVGEVIKVAKYADRALEVADAVHDMDKAMDTIHDAGEMLELADNTADTIKAGWRVGDDITNLTKAGNTPSWTTVRQRYWKNEAYYNASQYTEEALDLMKKGRAPIVDGFPMELHHPNGRVGQNFWEFYPLTHQEHHLIHYGW